MVGRRASSFNKIFASDFCSKPGSITLDINEFNCCVVPSTDIEASPLLDPPEVVALAVEVLVDATCVVTGEASVLEVTVAVSVDGKVEVPESEVSTVGLVGVSELAETSGFSPGAKNV